ncbi:MAG: hypothetical protein IJU78_05940 [Clostridia bacterium]|nr:hypothetical protein [Clostridia bacterium]
MGMTQGWVKAYNFKRIFLGKSTKTAVFAERRKNGKVFVYFDLWQKRIFIPYCCVQQKTALFKRRRMTAAGHARAAEKPYLATFASCFRAFSSRRKSAEKGGIIFSK